MRHHRVQSSTEESAALPLPSAKSPCLVFVGGFHATGKSTFCRSLAPLLGLEHLKASSLLKAAPPSNSAGSHSKAVANIDANQAIIVAGVAQRMAFMRAEQLPGLLLDGHFGLLKASGGFGLVPVDVFRALAPQVLILLEAAQGEVQARLAARGQLLLSLGDIAQLMKEERAHANEVAKSLGVSLVRARGDVPTAGEADSAASVIRMRLSLKDA